MIVHFLRLKKKSKLWLLSETFSTRQELIDFVRTFYANRGMLWLLMVLRKKYCDLKSDRVVHTETHVVSRMRSEKDKEHLI
jgi:hypothetical protein